MREWLADQILALLFQRPSTDSCNFHLLVSQAAGSSWTLSSGQSSVGPYLASLDCIIPGYSCLRQDTSGHFRRLFKPWENSKLFSHAENFSKKNSRFLDFFIVWRQYSPRFAWPHEVDSARAYVASGRHSSWTNRNSYTSTTRECAAESIDLRVGLIEHLVWCHSKSLNKVFKLL